MESNLNSIGKEIGKEINLIKTHRNYIYIIAGIVTLFISTLLFQECEHRKSESKLIKNIANYSDSSKFYKNKYGEIAFNQSLKFNTNDELKNYFSNNDTLKELLKKFKNVNSLTIVKDRIYIHDTVPVYYDRPIPCDFKPFAVRKDCTYYHFKGTIFPDKFTLDSILIPNKQEIVVGRKKINIFKYEDRVEIRNSNPHIQVTNVGNYIISNKKKWYERPAITLVGGLLIGGTIISFIK